MTLCPARFTIPALVVASVLGTADASADITKAQCVTANATGQDLRHDRKLGQAREQLTLCADPKCPSVVRGDCLKRLDELDAAQPTIAFEVKDAAGNDLIAVTLTMDGKPLTAKLDGAPLAIDPGQHEFSFQAAGQPAVTRTIVLTEGEKGRRERIVLGAPAAAQPPLPPVSPVPAPPTTEPATSARGSGGGTQKILGVVSGAAGVAGLAVGSIFGVITLSQKSQQQTDCAGPTSCANHAQAVSDHSAGMTDSTISTVGFVAGGALLIGGAVLFLTAGSSSERSPAAARLVLVPSAGPGGGGMVVRGEF